MLSIHDGCEMKELYRNPWKNGRYANHHCFCGSGKKLKRCHGQDHTLSIEELEDRKKLYAKWEASPEGLEFFRKMREGKA